MTSNLGSTKLRSQSPLGFSSLTLSESERRITLDRINEALKETFRPEFLNRIDEIIAFRPLGKEDAAKIAAIMLSDLSARLSELGIKFCFEADTLLYLGEHGFDEKYGARAMRRLISTDVEDRISEMIISDKIRAGDAVILYVKGGALDIKKAEL
jgi:ATP-dependent Clp protease ATP-binding subunit ClpC